MRAPVLLICLTTLLFIACISHPKRVHKNVSVKRQIAEFEAIDAIWLIWPSRDHKKGESVENVTLAIIDALVADLKIVVSCADKKVLKQAKNTLKNKYPDLTNISFRVVPSIEIWLRDMGPVFVETKDGNYAIADFNFNSWGYADTSDINNIVEEKYDERVGRLFNIPVISSSMISEGGNREVNSKGTLIITEAVEKGRNPLLSKAKMELEYQRLLGVKKVIWLREGLVEDRHTALGALEISETIKAYTVLTTNGHIDEFARFVNDSTILLAEVDSLDLIDPIARENHKRMEENFKTLSKSTDQDGKPFTIKRMPMPPTILTTMSSGDYVYENIKTLDYLDGSKFPEGDTITVVVPASYLNFIITNKVIVGQKYWRPGMDESIKLKDAAAIHILESVFPNKKVVMLDALSVNLGGGGLHCISMHQPKLSSN